MESQDSIAATSITSFDESEVRIDEGEDGIDGLPQYHVEVFEIAVKAEEKYRLYLDDIRVSS